MVSLFGTRGALTRVVGVLHDKLETAHFANVPTTRKWTTENNVKLVDD